MVKNLKNTKKKKSIPAVTKIEDIFDKAGIMVLCSAIIGIALFFDIRLYSTFDISKATLLFYSFIMLVTLWLIKCLLSCRLSFVSTSLDIPVLLFLGTFFLSTIFSIAPYTSFYGTYKRYEGLLAYICYIGLFYAAAYLLANNDRWQRYALYTIVFTVFIASAYGTIQHFGKDPLTWEVFNPYRIISTFGNPVFISVFLIIAFPLAVGLALWGDENPQKNSLKGITAIIIWGFLFLLLGLVFCFLAYFAPTPSGSYHGAISPFFIISAIILLILGIKTHLPPFFFILVAIFSYYCLSYTLTRASFLGFYISSLIFLLLLGRKEWILCKWRILALGLGCFLIFIIFLFNPHTSIINRFASTFLSSSHIEKEEKKPNYPILHDEIKEIKSYPHSGGKEYLPSIFGKHLTGSAAWRIYIWGAGAEITKDYPLVGIGPDTLGTKFPAYLKRRHPTAEKSHILEMEDRVHNEIVDTALGRGIPGLWIYFWCMIAFFLFFLYQRSRIESRYKKGILLSIITAQIAYLIQNQFSFGNTPLSSTFFFLLGIGVAIAGGVKRIYIPLGKFIKRWRILLSVFVMISTIILMIILMFPYAADYCYKESNSLSMWNRRNFEYHILELLSRSVKLHPFEPRYQEELMRNYVNFAMETDIKEKREAYLNAAEIVAKRLLKSYPENNSVYFTLGMVAHLRGKINEAILYYKKGLKLQPYVADMHNNLGLAYMSRRDYAKAAKHFAAAVHCRYNNPTFLERYAEAAYYAWGYSKAKSKIKKIIRDFDLNVYPHAYIVLGWLGFRGGDLELAEAANLQALNLDEKYIPAHRNLGVIYFRKQEYEKAYEHYRKVLDLRPDDEEAQIMLLRLGTLLRKS